MISTRFMVKINGKIYVRFLTKNAIRQRCERAFYISSYRSCSVRKVVLRNFEKFAGKHLCQSLLFNKVVNKTFFTENLWVTTSDFKSSLGLSFKSYLYLYHFKPKNSGVNIKRVFFHQLFFNLKLNFKADV